MEDLPNSEIVLDMFPDLLDLFAFLNLRFDVEFFDRDHC